MRCLVENDFLKLLSSPSRKTCNITQKGADATCLLRTIWVASCELSGPFTRHDSSRAPCFAIYFQAQIRASDRGRIPLQVEKVQDAELSTLYSMCALCAEQDAEITSSDCPMPLGPYRERWQCSNTAPWGSDTTTISKSKVFKCDHQHCFCPSSCHTLCSVSSTPWVQLLPEEQMPRFFCGQSEWHGVNYMGRLQDMIPPGHHVLQCISKLRSEQVTEAGYHFKWTKCKMRN